MDGGSRVSGETPEDKIIRLMRSSAPAVSDRRPSDPDVLHRGDRIGGFGNIVVGGNVTVKLCKPMRSTRSAAVEKIGIADRTKLQQLLMMWLDTRNAVKKKPMQWADAEQLFANAMGVSHLDEIGKHQFPAALKWFRAAT